MFEDENGDIAISVKKYMRLKEYNKEKFILISKEFNFSKYDLKNMEYIQINIEEIEKYRKAVSSAAARINDSNVIQTLNDYINWLKNPPDERVD